MGWQELELRRQPKDLKAEVFRLPRIRSLIVSDGRKEFIKPSNEVELKFIELLGRPPMVIRRGSDSDERTLNNIVNILSGRKNDLERNKKINELWGQMSSHISFIEDVNLYYDPLGGDGSLKKTEFKQQRSILFESGERKVVGHADNALMQIDNFLQNNKKAIPSSLKLTQRRISDSKVHVSEMEVSFWLLFPDFLRGIKDPESRNEYSIRFLNNIAENT